LKGLSEGNRQKKKTRSNIRALNGAPARRLDADHFLYTGVSNPLRNARSAMEWPSGNRENSGAECAIVAALMTPRTRKILKGLWHYVGRWVAWVIWWLGVGGMIIEPSSRIRSNYYIFGGIAAVYLLYRIFRPKPRPAPRPVSTVYGTARYAPLQADITDAACLSKGLFFGKSSEPGRDATAPGAPVCSTPEHHTLIVARTRTGKGTRVIVPTLLRYGGSALVIDPKGENAAITAMVRKVQLGQSIHILNPWNELAGTYDERGFKPATAARISPSHASPAGFHSHPVAAERNTDFRRKGPAAPNRGSGVFSAVQQKPPPGSSSQPV